MRLCFRLFSAAKVACARTHRACSVACPCSLAIHLFHHQGDLELGQTVANPKRGPLLEVGAVYWTVGHQR